MRLGLDNDCQFLGLQVYGAAADEVHLAGLNGDPIVGYGDAILDVEERDPAPKRSVLVPLGERVNHVHELNHKVRGSNVHDRVVNSALTHCYQYAPVELSQELAHRVAAALEVDREIGLAPANDFLHLCLLE